jgi:hypothetical protein
LEKSINQGKERRLHDHYWRQVALLVTERRWAPTARTRAVTGTHARTLGHRVLCYKVQRFLMHMIVFIGSKMRHAEQSAHDAGECASIPTHCIAGHCCMLEFVAGRVPGHDVLRARSPQAGSCTHAVTGR